MLPIKIMEPLNNYGIISCILRMAIRIRNENEKKLKNWYIKERQQICEIKSKVALFREPSETNRNTKVRINRFVPKKSHLANELLLIFMHRSSLKFQAKITEIKTCALEWAPHSHMDYRAQRQLNMIYNNNKYYQCDNKLKMNKLPDRWYLR